MRHDMMSCGQVKKIKRHGLATMDQIKRHGLAMMDRLASVKGKLEAWVQWIVEAVKRK